MSFAFDPTSDFTVFDAAVTVILGQAGQPALDVSGVVAFPLGERELELIGGELIAADVVRGFSLPVVQLAGRTPQLADTLTDPAGTVWRIQRAELATAGSRWRVWCRKQRS
jgi:hypothetical protein